jgi:hypothetical protein
MPMNKYTDTDYRRDSQNSFDNTNDSHNESLNASTIIHGDDFSLLMEDKKDDH